MSWEGMGTSAVKLGQGRALAGPAFRGCPPLLPPSWAAVLSSVDTDAHCTGSFSHPVFHVLGHLRAENDVLLGCDHQGWDQDLGETGSKGSRHSVTLVPPAPREGGLGRLPLIGLTSTP